MMSHAGVAVRSSWLLTVFAAASVVGVALAIYWPAGEAGFVGDDFMILHRLRALSRPSDALRFFRGEFFEYYRPLGFLSHALDWAIAGADPRQFHRTNLYLHAINAVLVLLITRALVLRPCRRPIRSDVPSAVDVPDAETCRAQSAAAIVGPMAALLFALHPSNHEAVVWVSARFDLLATCWSLTAIWWMVAGAPGGIWMPALMFAPALLSKESTVALPMAAAAWSVFCLRSDTRDMAVRTAPWLAVLAVYALTRQLAGGVPATGGAARAPKLILLMAALAFLAGCAGERWLHLRRLVTSRRTGGVVAVLVLVIVGGLAAMPDSPVAAVGKEKLTVAGFALVYLLAPVTDVGLGPGPLQPVEPVYLQAALAGLPLLSVLVWVFRRRLVADDRTWFLAVLLLAVFLPISALTEGRRYLYLPSAVVSIVVGLGFAHLRGRSSALALIAVVGLLLVSAARVVSKVGDWVWAGAMTADGARLVDSALAPSCNEGHVVFLTSPVGVRGVYTHFYYETFELPRGCRPATFQVVARVLRVDTQVEPEWNGPESITLIVPRYRGNLVLSEDLRQFDVPLPAGQARTLQTPLGMLRAEPTGMDQRVTLTVRPGVAPDQIAFFYFSDGRMHRLPQSTDPR
jgi:hypothetical protein